MLTGGLDEKEMLEIPGIDPDKVQRYGKRLLKLVRLSHQGYESMMRQEEDRPQDPNHQNVIDISSDDDANEYGGLDDLGDMEQLQEERSAYFRPPAEVEAFNAQCLLTPATVILDPLLIVSSSLFNSLNTTTSTSARTTPLTRTQGS